MRNMSFSLTEPQFCATVLCDTFGRPILPAAWTRAGDGDHRCPECSGNLPFTQSEIRNPKSTEVRA